MFSFAEGVEKPTDLVSGMKLPGIVTNVTAFGAFVDVGVHQDGLVHVSQLADKFVSDPAEIVKVGQKVHVTVTEVDLKRNRISLSMKAQPELGSERKPSNSRSKPNARSQGGSRNQRTDRRQDGSNKPAQSNDDWFSMALKNAKKK